MEENKKDLTEEVVDEVVDTPEEEVAEEVVEETTEQVADEVINEVTETMTAEEFDEENSVKDGKKAKKPADPKKKKIIIISVVAAVLVVVLAAVFGVLGFLGVFAPDAPPTVLEQQEIKTSLPTEIVTNAAGEKVAANVYVVGKDNAVDTSVAFAGYSDFAIENSEKASISGKNLTVTSDVIMTAKKDGATATFYLKAIPGVNVFGDSMEDDMRTALGDKKSVIMHQDLTTTGTEGFTINDGVTLYGNTHAIHGDSIAAPKDQKKSKKTSWGATFISLKGGGTIAEVHLIMNTVEGSITLEDFEFSGTGIDVNADPVNGGYKMAYITNCVVQNGQKLLNVYGADVTVTGSLFMNGADANIATGTRSGKPATHIILENVVSANSMVAGFLFYGFETDVPKGDTDCQQTLTIRGFFDIYNWKDTKSAKLVPSTEGAFIADTVNKNVVKEVSNEKFAEFLYDYNGQKYVHIGIIRLATGSVREQDPAIYYEDAEGNQVGGKRADLGKAGNLYPQFSQKEFPLPSWAVNLGIVKVVDMIGYKNQADFKDGETPYILPDSQIPADIMDQLRYGRNADGTANVPQAK